MASHPFDHSAWPSIRRSRRTHYALVVFWMAILAAYLWSAANHKERVNLSAAAAGQYPYLLYAKGMAEQGITRFVGDRNRMPVYPAILTLAYHKDWEKFFERSSWLSIAISIAVLSGIGWAAYATLPAWPATALTLAASVCLFVQKASFVGAELLFYGLLFGCWLVACRLIVRPDIRWAALLGVLMGCTYLTKASALLTVLAFGGIMVLQGVLLAFRSVRAASDLEIDETRSKLRQVIVCGLIPLFLFLAVSFPYTRTSQQRFGEWFYNVNSKFFMWCDSWTQARSFATTYRIEERPPEAAPGAIPGPGNYWRAHTRSQMLYRLVHGLRTLAEMAVEGAYSKYLAVSLLFCLALGLRQHHRFAEISHEHWMVVVFCLLFFGLQIICFAWYAQVAYGDRFLVSLFLPSFFAALWLSHRLSLAVSGIPILRRRLRRDELLAAALTLVLLGEGAALAASSLYHPKETFVRFYFNESHELLESGNLEEAARGFRGVIEFVPTFAPAHRDLGMTALLSGHYQEAIVPFSEAARLEPLNADFRNSLGSALLQAGRIDEAILEFKQATQLEPVLAVAWYNLGVSYHQRGDSDEAAAVQQRLSDLDTEWGRKLSAVLKE